MIIAIQGNEAVVYAYVCDVAGEKPRVTQTKFTKGATEVIKEDKKEDKKGEELAEHTKSIDENE